MLEHIRKCLLDTPQFESWYDLPANFYLEPVSENVFDLRIRAMPGHRIVVTPFELDIKVPKLVNAMQDEFELGSGQLYLVDEEGGWIRFSYKRKEQCNNEN